MAPKGTPRPDDETFIRTSLELPRALWRRAKLRALDDGTDLRTLIIEGLHLVLAQKSKKGGT